MENLISEKVIFKGKNGYNLAANLELPLDQPKAFAIFAHCFTCSKDSLAAFNISKALTTFGIAVLRFDFTGLGSSEGDFANTNFSSNVDDLINAASFLRENYQAPELLIGHSLGGAAVLVAAQKIAEVKAIATIGAPASLKNVEQLFANKLTEIKMKGEAEVSLGGRTFHINNQFLKDIENQQLLKIVSELNIPLLLFHSPEDEIVAFSNADQIFQAAKNPSFISLIGANHLLTRKDDSFYVAGILANWASRYLGVGLNDKQNKIEETSKWLTVRKAANGRFTQEILTGRHMLIADEPIVNGGNDLGPAPYDFLIAALGACTAMTVRLYAELKKIPLKCTIVKLRHEKIHADDCQNCETDDNAKIDHIDRLIEFEGDLSSEQREKLLAIANKCPVHRTLTSKISITTKLIEE